MSLNRSITRSLAAVALAGAAAFSTAADAAQFLFDTDPFAGTTALATPGRQIIGNETFIDRFDTAHDQFVFDARVFGLAAPLSFFNGPTAALGNGGYNVIVLQERDQDANPATPFLAGTAANVIANAIDTPGAGFFVYFNTVLGLNRLVFSTDLSDANADLKVLARLLAPAGEAAFAALPSFGADNFASVPEPSGVALLAGALAATALVRRRRQLPR
jgi:hypothetical protein